jgi:hypothetical protein
LFPKTKFHGGLSTLLPKKGGGSWVQIRVSIMLLS